MKKYKEKQFVAKVSKLPAFSLAIVFWLRGGVGIARGERVILAKRRCEIHQSIKNVNVENQSNEFSRIFPQARIHNWDVGGRGRGVGVVRSKAVGSMSFSKEIYIIQFA